MFASSYARRYRCGNGLRALLLAGLRHGAAGGVVQGAGEVGGELRRDSSGVYAPTYWDKRNGLANNLRDEEVR